MTRKETLDMLMRLLDAHAESAAFIGVGSLHTSTQLKQHCQIFVEVGDKDKVITRVYDKYNVLPEEEAPEAKEAPEVKEAPKKAPTKKKAATKKKKT